MLQSCQMLNLFKMASCTVAKSMLTMYLITVVLTVFLTTAEASLILNPVGFCVDGHFPCVDGQKCIRRTWFCDGDQDCADGSDESYCDRNLIEALCPPQWLRCADARRCYYSAWKCDGTQDCQDASDEIQCKSGIRSAPGLGEAERNLSDYLLGFRIDENRSINKWGEHTTRIAVSLFLNDRQFFYPGNKTGEEIAYELSLQLLSKLAITKRIPTNDLALFINALTVTCIDPKNFFGLNMVDELRSRVRNSDHPSPFAILTLCNAKDTMTNDDVSKLRQQYDARFRPVWTDTQAMVVMALSCISSRPDVNFDERILDRMVSELKRKQHKNGTIDNLRSTALVVQALLAAKSYQTDFDLDAAIKSILQEVRRTRPKIQDICYILPIFNFMSLANVSSDHCRIPVKTELEVISNLRDHPDKRIQVQVSVNIGNDMDFTRTWKVKVPSNYSLYHVLEDIGSLEPAYKFKYSVSQGKPYVVGLSTFQDDTEKGSFWFIYTKPLSSSGLPKLINESLVDIRVKESEELILWYKSGFWEDSGETAPQDNDSDDGAENATERATDDDNDDATDNETGDASNVATRNPFDLPKGFTLY